MFEVGETDRESGDPDRLEWVVSNFVSNTQVAELPEYHFTVKVEVPPDQEADNEIDCPISIVGLPGVIEPAESASLTFTVTAFEVTVLEALSVTWSSKLQDPVVDRAPVDVDGVSPTLQENELPRLL